MDQLKVVCALVFTYLCFLLYKMENKYCIKKFVYPFRQYELKQAKNDLPKWKKLLYPCKDKVNYVKREKNMKNITYATKTVITINKVINTENYKLKLFTFNTEGAKKSVGGDLWLVKIKSTSISFSIHLTDNMDGSYEGLISIPQSGNYSIHITLQYSLCHGILDPPLDWFKRGTFQGFGQTLNVAGGEDFIKKELPIKYIVVKSNNNFFHQCDYKLPDTCKHLNSKYGYWENYKYIDCWEISKQKKRAAITTSSKLPFVTSSDSEYTKEKLDTLIIFGDSMAKFFYESINKKPICTKLFQNCHLVYTWTYVLGRYSTAEEDSKIHDGRDFNETIFIRGISDALNDLNFLSSKNVVLINFGLHQTFNLQWDRMKKLFFMFLDFIDKIKMELGKFAPLFIWKTMTEPGQVKDYNPGMRFFTTQRAHLWNEFTIHEACKRGLPILHLYHMSASFPNGTRDRCHYDESAFYSAEETLYNYLKLYSFE